MSRMRLHRRLTDHEPRSDLGVCVTGGQQLEDLTLARAELLQAGSVWPKRRRTVNKAFDQALRDRMRGQCVPCVHGTDFGDQLLRWQVLEQETARTRA